MGDNFNIQQLKQQIMCFRVTELQTLLSFAGKNRNGKKNELQARALDLLKRSQLTVSIQNKIKELHKMRYTGSGSGVDAPPDLRSSCHTTRYSESGSSVNSGTSASMAKPLGASALGNRTFNSSATPAPNSLASSDYYSSMPRGLGIEYPGSGSGITSVSLTGSKMYSHGNHGSHSAIQYPVLADVKFKPLPFYDVYSELLKPATLIPTASSRFQESNFTFHLTPTQANDISMSREVKPDGKIEYVVQIQLRFCLLEISCEQEDNFPPSICVKVNSKMCALPNPLPTNKPGMEPKRPSRPVNITQLCRISPTTANQISVSWASEYGRAYVVGVFLVKKLSAQQLLQKIKVKGIRNSEYTRAMIKEKLAQDPESEIATMSLRGSLLCPLGKMRMQIPCRAVTCSHIQCFDGLLYLQMNEKKPAWVCPVCDKRAEYSHLSIDGLFTEIINQTPGSCSEVQFYEDGNWQAVAPKKDSCETVNVSGLKRNARKLSSDGSSPEPKRKAPSIDVITIDSDSENEDNKADPPSLSTLVLSSGSNSSTSSEATNIALPSPDSSSASSSLSSSQPLQSLTNQLVPSKTAASAYLLKSPSKRGIDGPATSAVDMSSLSSSMTSNNPYSTIPVVNNAPTYYPSSNNYSFSDNYMAGFTSHLYNQSPSFDMCMQGMYPGDVSVPGGYRGEDSSRRPMNLDPELINLE